MCRSAFASEAAAAAASVSQRNDRSVSLISSRSATVQSNDFKIEQKVDRIRPSVSLHVTGRKHRIVQEITVN